MLKMENSDVVVGDKVDLLNLKALFEGKISAIWHKGFYSQIQCENALPSIRNECDKSQYTITNDLQSLGTSIGEAAESTENLNKYFDTAPKTIDLIRNNVFGGQLSPIDKLRLMLDEEWPTGAIVAKKEGATMLSGIVRRWKKAGRAHPHIDQLNTPALNHLPLTRRVGVNTYLQVPGEGKGGEIEFWGIVTDEKSYESVSLLQYEMSLNEVCDSNMK